MYNRDKIKSEYPHHQEVIRHYKTTVCPSIQNSPESSTQFPKSCLKTSCYHYHSPQEYRRPLFDNETGSLAYDRAFCPMVSSGYHCQDGDACRNAHTQNEINYHPFYYKTEPCTNCAHPNNKNLCPRYHIDENNRVNILDGLLSVNNHDSPTYSHETKTKSTQFNVESFKAKQCTKKGNHNLKICPYYHHAADRRRPATVFSYIPAICPFITRNNQCPHGDNCRYAQNKIEQLYHPERYKRKFCLHHPHNIHKCEYGNQCSFAHNESEIQIELLHNLKQDSLFYIYKYKSVFCPYMYEHDRNQCVYAHNPQDLRRNPSQYKYNAVQCTFWNQGQIFSYEEGGCPNGMDCTSCHGWKELEYHPMFYRTKPCTNKKCTKKDCPFYHNPQEKRSNKATSQLTQSLSAAPKTNDFSKLHNMSENGWKQSTDSPLLPFPNQGMFDTDDSDGSRRVSSLPTTNFFAISTRDTEEGLAGMRFKQFSRTFDPQYDMRGFNGILSGGSYQEKYETAKSPIVDLWNSFNDQEEKLEDSSFTNKAMKTMMGENKIDQGSDSEDQNNNGEDLVKYLDEFLNEQSKKSTQERQSGHQMFYPKLSAFKGFHTDPVRIDEGLQDMIEGDNILSQVNSVTGRLDFLPNSYSDDDNFLQAFEERAKSPNLAKKLDRSSH